MRKAKLPYSIVRPLARIALTTYFRKIYFSNAQVIPKNKPVIIAANHPSAFLEPCILAVLLPRPLHFLVRGDFFSKPLFDKILRSLHMLPIFRMKDGGYQKIKNNFSTFDKCYATLEEGRVIMILAEGTTKHEKRLRPLKKGTGRLAFGTLEKYPDLDLQIIPVGVNYSNSDAFRSRAMIEFGQPISAQDYYQKYKDDANTGIKELTKDLRTALEKHVIRIENRADEKLTEALFEINEHSWPEAPQPAVSKNNYLLKSEMIISESVGALPEEEKQALSKDISDYKTNLQKYKLNDYAVAIGEKPKSKSWIVIILGFLPFLVGYLGNALPVRFADWIINKKVRAIEFRASVKITTAIVLYMIYWLTLFLVLLFTGHYSLIFVLLALPFFGYYALLYRAYFNKWKRLNALKGLSSEELNNLQEMRANLFKSFNLPKAPQFSN